MSEPKPARQLGLRERWLARQRRSRPVDVPQAGPSNAVIFLFMRRMRAPLIVVVTTFSVCTTGLMLMPGVDEYGNPYRLTVFDAFYQMTITLTTVGYSEVPHAFSYAQRMWLSASIYLVVISWAYFIGVFFSVIQDEAFRDAINAQRFRRRVRGMREDFFIIAGYGHAGRTVGAELDDHGRRFVVIDNREDRIQSLVSGRLSFDVPAVEGDCSQPRMLGMAGLGRPECEGVLALTSDDATNLSVVTAVSLLRPRTPVYARCTDDAIEAQMKHFAPDSAINPDDRFGQYLALSIHRPVNHQLLNWLTDNDLDRLPKVRRGLADGKWVVCAEQEFAEDVVGDLTGSGLDVAVVDPARGIPDVSGAVGFVAGTHNDVTNIFLADRVRKDNPDIYLVVRQRTDARKRLLDVLEIDSVHIATELVAREVLARILTPMFWSFVEYAFGRSEGWSTDVRDRLLKCCGEVTPQREAIVLSRDRAPAVHEWLTGGNTLTLRDLMRSPDDRDADLPLVALVLSRGRERRYMPAAQTPLRRGDQILFAGTPGGLATLREVRYYPSTVEYLATGREAPLTWAWAWLTGQRRAGA